MKFSAAIGFPFRGSHAWANIGCMLVCFLIPIIGPIVADGYLVGVKKRLIENIEADAPPFDFSRFTVYLQLGLPPFVTGLILMVIAMAGMIPLGLGLVLSIILLHDHTTWLVVAISTIMLGYLAFSMAFGVAFVALVFKSAVEESYTAALDHVFLLSYVKRVGWLALGTQLVMMVLTVPFMILACVPFVGAYVAMAMLTPIHAHIASQLYLAYVMRGGAPLSVKPEAVELSAFPVLMKPLA